MTALLLLAGLAALANGGNAVAQEAAESAGLARQCTTEGGFGERFGVAELAGRVRMTSGNNVHFDPVRPVPPFEQFEAGVTQWGRKTFRFGATAEFADNEAARRAYAAMVAEIARNAWTRSDAEDDQVDFLSDSAGRPDMGTRFNIMLLGRGVWLDCTDLAGQAIAYKEAFGPAPDMTRRPEPPTLPEFPALPLAGDCAVPERRDAILAEPLARIEAMMAFVDPALKYAERLAEWKGQQLVKRGVWTEQRRKDFYLGLLQNPDFTAEFSKSLDGMTAIMTTAIAMGDAEKRGDGPAQCRATVEMLGQLKALARTVGTHWQVVHDAYALEAGRLGVKLE